MLANPTDSPYRWLEQQGEAFGNPGVSPRWTSSLKDAVGTAYSASSRIWFTVSHGILNEIYHPTIDRPQTRDMGLIVTDGETSSTKKSATSSRLRVHPSRSPGRPLHQRDKEGRYTARQGDHLRPAPLVVLMHVRLEAGPNGSEDLLNKLKHLRPARPAS
jgi:glucoamylase